MTSDVDLGLLPASRLTTLLRDGELSSRELLAHYLERIERLDPAINAVVVRDAERAAEEARHADERIARGEPLGPLHGVPMTVKESLDVAGLPTTVGALELADNVATEDAAVVTSLREAGAVIFGKTNLPTYASDGQAYNDIYGTTNNPWDLELTPSGSSGGSAAALAAGLTGLEVGSDIAGSIRLPAHACGVYGLKPTWGTIPDRGCVNREPGHLAPRDMSTLGPLGRSIDDLELALGVIAGPPEDARVAWRLELPPPRHGALDQYRLAVWLDDPFCAIDGEVSKVLGAAIGKLDSQGARLDDAPPLPVSLEEAHELFGPFIMGKATPELEERRHQMRHRWAEFFGDVDALLCPVSPVAAIPHDHSPDMFKRTVTINGEERSYNDQTTWTVMASVAYLPALSVPAGRTAAGLPVGLQVIGPYLEDRTVLSVGRHVDAALGAYEAPPLARDVPVG